MVGMGMGNENVADICKIDTVKKAVIICIGREINKKLAVNYRLRTGANVFSSALACLGASFAFAKKCGDSFCRRSAKIL